MSLAVEGTVCLVGAILGIAAVRSRQPVPIASVVLALALLVGTYMSASARVQHLSWPPHRGPAAAPAPPRYSKEGYRPLADAAMKRIPRRSTYALVPVKRAIATFRLRYLLAPRICTEPSRTHWVLVLGGTPAAAGVVPRESWKFGDNWLVRT